MVSLILFSWSDMTFSSDILGVIVLTSFGLVYLPWFLPAEMAKSNLSIASVKSQGLSSFVLSLPVSNFSIAIAKLKLASRSTFLFHAMVLIVVNLIIFSLETELCKYPLQNDVVKPCFINPWDWLVQQFGAIVSLMVVISANLLIPVLTWTLAGNTLSWCLKGDKYFTVRITIILVIGFLLVLVFGLFSYTSVPFRIYLWSFAPIVNVIGFGIIITIFVRALKRFQRFYSLNEVKSIGALFLSVLMFFTVTIYLLRVEHISNLHATIIFFDLTLLGILPLLTSPFSVAQNRAR
ncbi:MAG: hypothetical protein L3J46_03260 [Kangiellaceae bacterium]|nr:hypothetical protein [Kangiellaceae bacterium]